jgi:hypothetical protein
MSAISLPSGSWIISKGQDLFWFIGAALLGYLLLLVSASQGELPLRLLILWAFAIDGPHVFSTATRVLLDPAERKRIGFLWLALIPLCLAGPAIIFAANQHVFYMLIATWSHYHISKQHMGFMFIYKRKARETSDFKLDKYFVLTLLILPYLFYLTVLLTSRTDLLPLFLVPAILFAIYYSIHQAQKVTINYAKIFLLLACIPFFFDQVCDGRCCPKRASQFSVPAPDLLSQQQSLWRKWWAARIDQSQMGLLFCGRSDSCASLADW